MAFNGNYITSLVGIDKERYENKIKLLGLDPYEIHESVTSSEDNDFPSVNHEGIQQYLINSTDPNSMEQKGANKALQAHRFYSNGWVQSVKVKQVQEKKVSVVLGQVKHSYGCNEKPLKCWVVVKNSNKGKNNMLLVDDVDDIDCDIITGHCTCKAGLSEACSHVAAVLFYLLDLTMKSCTSLSNRWIIPSVPNVTCCEIKDVDFTSAKKKFKDISVESEQDVSKKRKLIQAAPTTEEERNIFLKKAAEKNLNCVVMAVLPDFVDFFKKQTNENFINSCTRSGNGPVILLGQLYDRKYTNMLYEEVVNEAETNIFPSIKISGEKVTEIEEATRKQSECQSWYDLRKGRITASVMKRVCRTDVEDPSVSLIKEICYSSKFYSPYTEWGKTKENVARQMYIAEKEKEHINFKFKGTGLMISSCYPFIGASPDGMVSCDCHPTRLLEIKCIFPKEENDEKENIDVNRIKKKKKINPDSIRQLIDKQLPTSHKFYYQIQTQLYVWKLSYCDLVVWEEKMGIQVQKVYPDEEFQREIVSKATEFFKKALLPELMSRYFSARKNSVLGEVNYEPHLTCICQRPATKPMINCGNDKCKIKTFHYACVGVKAARKKWLCSKLCEEEYKAEVQNK